MDTSGLQFVLVGGPDPVLGFGTMEPRTDDAGVPLFAVKVVGLGDEAPEVFTVKVPGEPQGVVLGSIVADRRLAVNSAHDVPLPAEHAHEHRFLSPRRLRGSRKRSTAFPGDGARRGLRRPPVSGSWLRSDDPASICYEVE